MDILGSPIPGAVPAGTCEAGHTETPSAVTPEFASPPHSAAKYRAAQPSGNSGILLSPLKTMQSAVPSSGVTFDTPNGEGARHRHKLGRSKSQNINSMSDIKKSFSLHGTHQMAKRKRSTAQIRWGKARAFQKTTMMTSLMLKESRMLCGFPSSGGSGNSTEQDEHGRIMHRDPHGVCIPTLHPEHKVRTIWDALQVGALMYVAVVIPYRVGFADEADLGSFSWCLELVIDVRRIFHTLIHSFAFVRARLPPACFLRV